MREATKWTRVAFQVVERKNWKLDGDTGSWDGNGFESADTVRDSMRTEQVRALRIRGFV